MSTLFKPHRPMTSNNIRFDLSDRLIHFFWNVNLEGNTAPAIQPEHFAFNSAVEGTTWPALFLLRCAVRSHRLWATWSVRSGVRTVYGPHPAVCFSEMPLAAFLETSIARERLGQAISSYALSFPKSAMYTQGALPVIYGLSQKGGSLPPGSDGGARIMPSSVLPLREQYRYVTYNPSGAKKVDWTHEREWRWAYTGDLSAIEGEMAEYGVVSNASDIPGFDFADANLRGIGIVVKTDEDARKLRYDVLSLVDRGLVARSHFDHLLVLDRLPKTQSLYSPEAVNEAIHNATLDFSDFFDLSREEVDAAVADLSQRAKALEKATASTSAREQGGCWLWFHDNTSPYVRALVQAGRVQVNYEGRYVASLNEIDANRDLRMREEMVTKLSADLKRERGVPGSYFSVLNSTNPDRVPFYIGDEPEDDLYHNTDY